MIDIGIAIGRVESGGKPRSTTAVTFPQAFMTLDNAKQVTLIGRCSEYIAKITPDSSVRELAGLPNPTRASLIINDEQGDGPGNAEIVFLTDLSVPQRQCATLAIGAGLHECAVELARKSLGGIER